MAVGGSFAAFQRAWFMHADEQVAHDEWGQKTQKRRKGLCQDYFFFCLLKYAPT